LAKQEKYRIDFYSLEGYQGRVSLYYEGYTGAVINLVGGERPFVLREFNTEENIYKPIRAQLAEIEILASATGTKLDDFLATSDTDIQVYFYYYSFGEVYWTGFVMQADYREEWQDQNHIITITATDGFGKLKDILFSNSGIEVTSKQKVIDMIQFATGGTALGWDKYQVINNLYHDSMSTTYPNISLNQTYIDPKTFEIEPSIYESSYDVLEKINISFNQNIFMYRGFWNIMRVEELYAPSSSNLKVLFVDTPPSGPITYNKRFDLQVGVGYDIKPISPQMLRYIRRLTNQDIVEFNYERFVEVINNSSFVRGDLLLDQPTLKQYEVDNWTFIQGNPLINSPVTSVNFYRNEEYTSVSSPILDNYVAIPQDLTLVGAKDYLIQSEPIDVFSGERLRISFELKFDDEFTGSADAFPTRVAYVKLIGLSGTYYLLSDGKWTPPVDPSFGVGAPMTIDYGSGQNLVETEWNTFEVESYELPDNGTLYFYFVSFVQAGAQILGQRILVKNFDFQVYNRFDQFELGLQKVQATFTKANSALEKQIYTTYFDDQLTKAYRGCIFESDATTPTDNNWFRLRYSGERQPFRKENAITHWSHNRYNRNKIDANFYGLTWEDTLRVPIGLINTVRFMDDDPNKIYYIANLKEIDFASATWSATLEEVWDNARDGSAAITRSFTASVKVGTYVGSQSVPYLTGSNTDFVVTADNKIIYKGAQTITNPITISLAGNIIATSGAFPVQTSFLVKQNGTTIKTQTYPVNVNPQAFTFNLSPAGSITINPNDIFEITFSATEVGKTLNSIQFTSGTFNVNNYTVPNALNYDTYTDKYIYK
jgi:hypothetical protein